jgi:hypothetical protein
LQDATVTRQELGKWIGRIEAFLLVANRCTAAQAECLRNLKESELYKTLGLTWEQFCDEYAGISRATADRLIQRLEEFGAAYFRLTQLMRISPDVYRQIAGNIKDNTIELDGEAVPIAPENAPRIASAIRQMRQRLETARRDREQACEELRHLTEARDTVSPRVERNLLQALQARLEICLGDLAAFARRAQDHDTQMRLNAFMREGSDRLRRLATTYNPARTCPPAS